MPSSADLIEHLEAVSDPRRREPVYPLTNILFMAVCDVIAGADGFVAIAKYARTKKAWFKKFLDLSAGIPSHDRFNAILASIKPAEFEKADYWLAVKGNQGTLHKGLKAFFSTTKKTTLHALKYVVTKAKRRGTDAKTCDRISFARFLTIFLMPLVGSN